MLKIDDKVYLHIKDLETSINRMGFNIDRLCKIKDISTAKDSNNNEVGIYTLKCVDSDKEYRVMTNDRMWKMTDANQSIDIIKASVSLDEQTKEQIIEKIYE